MKVVVTIAALNPAHGGPARTIPALCRALVNSGAEVTLLTVSEGESNVAAYADENFKLEVVPSRTNRYQSFSWRVAFRRALEQLLRTEVPTVLYDVGLWLPANHFVASIARTTATPLVVSPRGMLSTTALQVSKWKKRLAWEFYQRRDLQVARVLHATSDAEASDFRARGLRQPIAIIPNGIDVAESWPQPTATKGPRTALFLSRLHPIKGLRDLVEAWARVRPADWRVVIAGPDEHNHRAKIETLLSQHNLRDQFEFVGAVDDLSKWTLYRSSELFILPSHSESFGQVIGEALAAGVPVITTRATPWSGIGAHRCGWYIDTGVEPLVAALIQATGSSSDELRQMGARGQSFVTQSFSWDTVGRKMMALFEWLVGSGLEPESVI